MKKILFLVILFSSIVVKATHIVGGELIYQHLGGSSYYITVKLYKDCNPGTQNFPTDLEIEAFTGFGLDTIGTLPADDYIILPRLGRDTLPSHIDTCAFNPGVCVEEAIYGAIVNLPPVPGGYHLFYQTYARNGSLLNIVDPLQAGETFYAYIPDNSLYLTNSSPVFSNSPPVFVCQGYDLDLDFGATDVDGDSLVYSFYRPYTGRSWDHPDHYDPSLYYPTIDLLGTPPDNITFPQVVYIPGFSASNPLNAIGGVALTISSTGIINGIPEAIGQYVVGVMVEEYRDGVKIGEIVRDFQFNVLNCPPPQNAGIGDIDGCSGYVVDFINESGPGAIGFWWDFGTGNPADTSIVEEPTFDYTPYAPGTFTVTLIAQKGTTCADTTEIELIVSGVVADFIVQDTACAHEPIVFTDNSTSQINGVLDTWNWDFGDGGTSALENPTHAYPTPGDYVVRLIVSSDIGCTDTIIKTVHVRARPGAGILPIMGCIGLEVTFTNTSSLDVENFHWDFGTGDPADTSNLFNPTFTFPDFGIYTVTLYSEPNTYCADTATRVFMISNVIADFNAPDSICSNVLIDFEDLSTNVNGSIFSWEWDFGDGSSSTSPDPSYGYTVPGTYTITLVVISTIGCTDTLSREITIYDSPVALIGATDFCNGLTVDFVNGSGLGAGDFWWDFGTGSPADTSNLENPTFTYGSYGTYTVTLIAQRGTVCETSTTLDVVISDLDGAFFMPDTACALTDVDFLDLSTTLIGTTLTEWEWDFGDLIISDLQNPTHSYTTGGDYVVTFVVHSSVGCTDTVVQTIHIQSSPTPFAGEDTAVCLMDPALTLNGVIVGADSGIWSGDGGVFSPSATDLDATYFPTLDELTLGYSNLVLTTVGNGFCEAQTDTIEILYLGDPNINAGEDIEVCEDSTYINLEATLAFESGVIWTTEGDGTFSDDESTLTTYTFGPLDISSGFVTIYVNTINFSGCPEDVDTVHVTFNDPVSITAMSDTLICSGFPLVLNSNSSTGDGVWFTSGDGIFDPETGDLTSYLHGTEDLADGSVIIYFESADNGGCPAKYDTLTVSIIPSPDPGFTFDENCFGEPTTFVNTSESTDPIETYFWTFEPGVTSAVVNPTHTFSTPGIFEVSLIVISENGCRDTITQEVRSHFIPVADFEVPTPCVNGGTLFVDSSNVGNSIVISWNWNFGDGSAIDTNQFPIHQFTAAGNYPITLTVVSEFGCTNDTTINVQIGAGPTAAFNVNPESAKLYVPISFTDLSIPNGSPIIAWDWDFKDGTTISIQNPIHTYIIEGEYNVELVVTDELGCKDTAVRIVPVYHGPLVPSAFSPNLDGNNDFLMILGGNFSAVEFTIFNNWGEVVYETTEVDAVGWDGTYKNEPQPLGVYVYVAKVVTFDGQEHVLSGDVSLIR